MPAFYVETQREFDCRMLVEPRRVGSTIGYLAGTPITETVIDLFGRRFALVGIAPRKRDGHYDIDSLRPREFIVEPGLLYRMDSIKQVRREVLHSDALPWNYHVLPPDVVQTEKWRKGGHEIDFIILFWLGVALGTYLLFLVQNTG